MLKRLVMFLLYNWGWEDLVLVRLVMFLLYNWESRFSARASSNVSSLQLQLRE